MRRPPNIPKTLEEMLFELSDGISNNISSVYAYDPHPKQKIFHCTPKDMKLFIGGNRSGKTVANVVECIWRLIKKHPFRPELNEIEGEIRGRMSVVNFNDGLYKIVLPLFKKWMPVGELIDRNWDKSYDKNMRVLTLANGSFIEFMSYDQDLDAFAGTSRHFCSFDEEPPRSIFNECMMRLVDTDGDWWISMTPIEGLTWVFEELYEPYMEQDMYKEYLVIIQVSSLDNPHISKKALDKFFLLQGYDEAERHARTEGSFHQIGGRVYKCFDKNIHALPRGEFRLTEQMRIWTSVDTGFRHPAAWLWHAVSPAGHIVTFHEIVRSELTVEEFAGEIHRYENAMRKLFPWFTVYARTGDPAISQVREHTGTSVQQEYAKHGLYIGVEGVPRQVEIGVIRVTQYLKATLHGRPMWQYTDDCVVLEQQMKALHWERYSSKKMEYDKAPKLTIDKKNDDAPDSLRYFMTLMDDLTPDKLAFMEEDRSHYLHSVPYYTGKAEVIPDYQTYNGSLIVNLEGA